MLTGCLCNIDYVNNWRSQPILTSDCINNWPPSTSSGYNWQAKFFTPNIQGTYIMSKNFQLLVFPLFPTFSDSPFAKKHVWAHFRNFLKSVWESRAQILSLAELSLLYSKRPVQRSKKKIYSILPWKRKKMFILPLKTSS